MCTYNTVKPICSTLVLVLTLLSYNTPAKAFDIFLGTAGSGTFSHFSGRMIERTINKQIKDVNCKVVTGSGDIHNLTNLQQGSLDIALVDSRMLYDAINRTGNFEFLDINYKNLSVLVPFYDVPITLIVGHNSGIKKLADLKGKRINAGKPLSPQNLLFKTISTAKNWSQKDFMLVTEISDSQSQDTMAFCHGNIDAMIHMGIHPNPSLQQLFKLCNAKMADMDDPDIDKLVSENPAFSKLTIPSDTYPGQETDINTLGTQTFLVASRDLDEETVYKILDAIFNNRERFSNAHPALSLQKPDMLKIKAMGINLHAGAAKYFSED
jgi:TRAP transporter TAXI family solute receptor